MSAEKAVDRLMGILEAEEIAVYSSSRTTTVSGRHTTVVVELNVSGDPHVIEDLINRIAAGLADDGGEEA